MLHIGMTIRLTNTVEAPEAVTDSTGVVVGIDFDPDELTHAREHASTIQPIEILHKLPIVDFSVSAARLGKSRQVAATSNRGFQGIGS